MKQVNFIVINPDSLSATLKLCKKCKRSCTDNGCPIIDLSSVGIAFAYFPLTLELAKISRVIIHVVATLILFE